MKDCNLKPIDFTFDDIEVGTIAFFLTRFMVCLFSIILLKDLKSVFIWFFDSLLVIATPNCLLLKYKNGY